MGSEQVTAVVQYGVMVAGGVFATLLGYRLVGPPPGKNPKYDPWFEKNGVYLRVLGPVLIVGGIGMMAFRLVG